MVGPKVVKRAGQKWSGPKVVSAVQGVVFRVFRVFGVFRVFRVFGVSGVEDFSVGF